MRPDLIDSFFGLSLFKQLALIFLCGPLVASVWMLIADRARERELAVEAAREREDVRKAA